MNRIALPSKYDIERTLSNDPVYRQWFSVVYGAISDLDDAVTLVVADTVYQVLDGDVRRVRFPAQVSPFNDSVIRALKRDMYV